MRGSKIFLIVIVMMVLAACTQVTKTSQIRLNLLQGWFGGAPVYYVTTDVSDREMARQMRANYVPRLRDAIPEYPKPPKVKTILERVYAFPNGEQQKTVFASAPKPIGYASEDLNYSPVWLVYQVQWLAKDKVRELRSEGDIFKEEAEGSVTIIRTNIVVNCPIVSLDNSVFLPTP